MTSSVRQIGRYSLHQRLATGGMAIVHIGRLHADAGFARVVAIKRLHDQFATDPEFVDTLVTEARLVSRIRHPNVVPVLDLVVEESDVLLVMEYIHGLSVSEMIRACRTLDEHMPMAVAVAVMADALRGLHAAHAAVAEDGTPLNLIHRDVSPQNILVSSEGAALIADFGIAKAVGRSRTTKEGHFKGKLAYAAPEQLAGEAVTRRTDVYAASVVLWELLAGQTLFHADSEAAVYTKVIQQRVPPLSGIRPEIPSALEACVQRGLSRNPEARFSTALQMAEAIEALVVPASRADVATWVAAMAGGILRARAEFVAEMERATTAATVDLTPATVGPLQATASPNQNVAPRRLIRTTIVVLALFAASVIIAFSAFRSPTHPRVVLLRHLPNPSGMTSGSTFPQAEPTTIPASQLAPSLTAPPRSAPASKPQPAKSSKSALCRTPGPDGIYVLSPCADR